MKFRTLVLNAGYEPLQLIDWQRAICLIVGEKADVLSEYRQTVRSVNLAIPLPSVVRLRSYVRVVTRYGLVRCTRRNILLRDRHQCQYCGVQGRIGRMTIDHVMPRSRGGKTTWDNVVAACHHCNHRKGDRSLDEMGYTLLSRPRKPLWHDLIEEYEEPAVDAWMPWLQVIAG